MATTESFGNRVGLEFRKFGPAPCLQFSLAQRKCKVSIEPNRRAAACKVRAMRYGMRAKRTTTLALMWDG